MNRHICQGPECHTYKTQSRIRGPKGSKVLRTRPARYDMTTHSWGYVWERYFCDERCMQNCLAKHMTQLINYVGINTKPKESPISIEQTKHKAWNGQEYTRTTIKLLSEQLDNDMVEI